MKKENPITPAQLKTIHVVLRALNIDDDTRHLMVYQHTDGRTDSTKELTEPEAASMIKNLRTETEKMVKKQALKTLKAIYSLSFRISFLNEGYSDDTPEEREMNKAKINRFARQRSSARKPVNQMGLAELDAFRRQLDGIARAEERKKKEAKKH